MKFIINVMVWGSLFYAIPVTFINFIVGAWQLSGPLLPFLKVALYALAVSTEFTILSVIFHKKYEKQIQ